jgi:hypothetical protein
LVGELGEPGVCRSWPPLGIFESIPPDRFGSLPFSESPCRVLWLVSLELPCDIKSTGPGLINFKALLSAAMQQEVINIVITNNKISFFI